MDLFPLVLTRRDLDSLYRIIQEWYHPGIAPDIIDDILVDDKDLEDADKVIEVVSRFSRKEMGEFLQDLGIGLADEYKADLGMDIVRPPDSSYPSPEDTERVLSIRQAIADLQSIRKRIRSPQILGKLEDDVDYEHPDIMVEIPRSRRRISYSPSSGFNIPRPIIPE